MFTQRVYLGSFYLLLACVLAICGSLYLSGSANAQMTIGPGEEYDPSYTPEDFTIDITNPYFSMPVGQKMVYESQTPDGLETIEILIPGWTRTVDGVETLVFWDRVYLDGQLIEDTRDYLAQHKETGDVWYFGEHVDNYEDGQLIDHDGAWLTGEDGAKPGLWMLGDPQVGDQFRNEYLKGEAEDQSEVLSITESVTVPYGDFTDCVQHLDGSPLFEAKAHAYYCKGIANETLAVDLVGPDTPEEQIVELVEVDDGGALDMTEVPSAFAEEGVVGPSATSTSDSVTCESPSGVTIPMPTTYLYLEHNSTDGDTGIHGMFDSSTFAELCVYDPSGTQILAVKPQNQLEDLTMAGIFFESREPPHEDIVVEDHLQNFPEGQYEVRGVTYDGIGYHGAATFTHNVPNPPQMIFPAEMVDEENIKEIVIAPENVVIEWEPVTETIFGDPVKIAGYEVIVRRLTPSNPHGFAHANYDVHVLPTRTSLTIPDEFWEPNTPYEWEVLALETSGNQTLISGFFETGEAGSSASAGEPIPFDEAQAHIEHNSSDEDLGFSVEIDAPSWKQVKIMGLEGETLFEVKNSGTIGTLGLTHLVFGSTELGLDELSREQFLKRFPAGAYKVVGETVEGEMLQSPMTVTHTIPDAPQVITPEEGAVVPLDEVVVVWEPVTSPKGIEIENYVVKVFPTDPPPEGMPMPDFNVDFIVEMPATVTEMRISAEVLKPGFDYTYEVMAVESNLNQTVTVGTFVTEMPQ